jgi:hypothetical protein
MNEWLSGATAPDLKHTTHLPFDRLVLNKPTGDTFSLHRFAGRWIIVRVAERLDAAGLLPESTPGLDAVALNVVAGPIVQPNGTAHGAGEIAFDTDHLVEQRFPTLDWPAIFVLDPHGRLAAILTDEAYGDFLAELVRRQRRLQTSGAIDRRDIHS